MGDDGGAAEGPLGPAWKTGEHAPQREDARFWRRRLSSSRSGIESSKTVSRFCLVEESSPSVMAEVTSRVGESRLNIVGNTTKLRGNLLFQVLDIEVGDSELSAVQAMLCEIEGVLTCSVGSFDERSGAIYNHNAPVRLCIVTDNLPGVLGRITHLLGVELGLKSISQVNRSRGNAAYNVFDLENVPMDWDIVCRKVEDLGNVHSCTLGNFKAGDMAGLTSQGFASVLSPGGPGFAGSPEAPAEAPGASDDATDTEDTLSVKSARSASTEPASKLRGRAPSPLASSVLTAAAASASAMQPASLLRVRSMGIGAEESMSSRASATSAPAGPELRSLGGADYYEEGAKGKVSRTKQLTLLDERNRLTHDASKLVLVMVGLPARGKSFTARKLKRFLSWRNRAVKIFNAGRYRRERASDAALPDATAAAAADRADLFQSGNEEGKKVRQEAADRALKDLLGFLSEQKGAAVGIFDATNSTNARRQWITEQCKGVASVVFVEVICDDNEMLTENLLAKIRSSPDFAGMDEQVALQDLLARIENYAKVYEPLTEDDLSYIKLYNMSTKILANKIYGRLARSILPYMLSLHVGLRPIWFVRAGLSVDSKISYNAEYELLDPSTESKAARLSDQGREFARRLASWLRTAVWLGDDVEEDVETMLESGLGMRSRHDHEGGRCSPISRAFSKSSITSPDTAVPRHVFDRRDDEVVVRRGDGTRQQGAKVKVLCSTLPRAEETAQIALSYLDPHNVAEPVPVLNPLDKGELAGLSMEEITAGRAEFYDVWSRNKYMHRFPGGESYHDLCSRLEPVLIEIEQQTAPVLIVSHVSCIQALLAYYLGCPVQEAMKIKVPMHKIIEVAPTIGGSWDMNVYEP